MNHPEEITKTTPNYIIKWVLKERQQELNALRERVKTLSSEKTALEGKLKKLSQSKKVSL